MGEWPDPGKLVPSIPKVASGFPAFCLCSFLGPSYDCPKYLHLFVDFNPFKVEVSILPNPWVHIPPSALRANLPHHSWRQGLRHHALHGIAGL